MSRNYEWTKDESPAHAWLALNPESLCISHAMVWAPVGRMGAFTGLRYLFP